MGESEEKITNRALVAQLRQQARLVNVKVLVAGVLLTLAALALPMMR